jgi:hypothetical protein
VRPGGLGEHPKMLVAVDSLTIEEPKLFVHSLQSSEPQKAHV